ncbi:hypothetical protein B0T16DRAFT_332399 [Cercophora newfieldiana]|uniref:SH3 domain-containing protein n=1 Tax=Cercophora newfieldiana TaxID=92897 RepID=A0AA39Y2G8_9PEZI|nr:hypothetical protein B0T16DRAFT_332399 [Cercophora newfieldiana]
MSFKVKAIFDYASGHEDDLPFNIGQIITVTDEEDADWYGGEYVDDAGTKHEGIFPRNFVEKYEPTAPPRPSRARPKKESDSISSPVAAVASPVIPSPESPKLPPPEPEEAPEPTRAPSPTQTTSAPRAAPAPAPVPEASVPKPAPPTQAPASPQPAAQPFEAPTASSAPPPKPAPTQSKPSGPPPVSEKPSAFRDRIAAFNKQAAPPIAPFKPTGLGAGSSGFIKKPFVAPPPSRHAYIPPPQQAPTVKLYRRDEDPEIKEQEATAVENAGKAGLIPTSNEGEAEEDQPKPLSLKERMALLQKQQMETAARHADAVAKKEKPKRPPKKRLDSHEPTEEGEAAAPPPLERRDTEESSAKKSLDEPHPPRLPHPPRRKSSKGIEPRDGNEADMSGAGDTTEGQEDDLTEREDSDERPRRVSTAAQEQGAEEEEEDEEEEDEDDVDPEVRRKEELRARMAKMSGGMGMPGMPGIPLFGGPPPALPKKKKSTPTPTSAQPRRSEDAEEPLSPTSRAPPVPMMMALPGLSRPAPVQETANVESDRDEEEEANLRTPHQETAPSLPSRESGAPPPVPSGRPAPPPVPADSRPPPPPPPASAIKSPSEGSASDDELSERPYEESDTPRGEPAQATRAPPLPPISMPPPLSPTSPGTAQAKRPSFTEDASPLSPIGPAPPPPPGNRASRLPPPIPGSAPAPPSAQTRPPPPPPGAAPPQPSRDDDGDEEITEYEGDYDTDIASSVPHKDALKSHQRESSFEDVISPRSPVVEAPPIPSGAPPRADPPPVPTQAPPPARQSVDVPRAAPPPPPVPAKEAPRQVTQEDDEYDPYNYSAASIPSIPAVPAYAVSTPPPPMRRSEDLYSPESPSSYVAPQNPRAPPPAPPPGPPPVGLPAVGHTPGRAAPRQSLDVQRNLPVRRSVDVNRPSMESGFVANEIDLATQSGWWLQPNSLPPQLQGRKDIFFESEESSAANRGKTTITRDIYVLFQDYSQTVITVRFDPQDASDVNIEQRHEAPPRALRQDQLEQSYERFGRAIGEAVVSKKDTVVGDGTPQALVYELLRPFKDALLPVGSRAYGALVYSNLANASTTQNDEIRAGDIISIRNAKFQGKHGAMHAKYSMEVGKPDHVAVVAEWDGTKKKVRAWEQGRESKKVKLESFKLDDLRSGEVKIWRVMPRSWIGWEGGN